MVVLAPTNNAIEQVLYGVLEKLQAQQIALKNVIRLGTPSMKFAEAYGEICEVQGVEKRLAEISGQIRFLQSILDHRRFLERLRFAEEEITPMFVCAEQILFNIGEERKGLLAVAASVSAAERFVQSCRAEQLSSAQLVSQQRKHMQSLGYRIARAFSPSSKQTAEAKLSQLEKAEKSVVERIAPAEDHLSQTKIMKDAIIARLTQLDQTMDARLRELSHLLATIPGFHEIKDALNRNTLGLCKERLLEKVALGNAIRIKKLEEFIDFQDTENDEIEKRIAELTDQHALIAAQTTEERLKDVKIIAATIDTFLFRFQPADYTEKRSPIPFQHIFLDEAGYCALAKALILFGYGRPVTMLGDHMQLPPVCEANDDELQSAMNENAFLFAQSALYVEDAFLCANAPARLLEQYLHHEAPLFSELCKNDLRETYRFGVLLAKILEQYVYRNGFRSANADAPFAIEVLDAPRTPESMRRQSTTEAQAIAERLQYLGTDDYAILAPYRNQVQLLSHAIPEAYEEQRIMTIHASQGREWDTVFLSVVDTSDMYFTNTNRPNIGGLQIINTAISRAKTRLVIVCDVMFWQKQEGQMIGELVLM